MYYKRREELALAIIMFLNGFVYAQPVRDINNNANAPIIEVVNNEVELPFGVAWNVSCKSNVPIAWKPYDPWFDWTPPNVFSTAISTGDAEMQYGAVLSISNASAASVGRYYCVISKKKDEDMEEMEIEDFASSVYVFVKDYKQPIVPIPGQVYYIQSEEVFIPCKPSYRGEEVELCNMDGECLRTYNDPTKGFQQSKASLKIPADGLWVCKCDIARNLVRILPAENELFNREQVDLHNMIDETRRVENKIVEYCFMISFIAFLISGIWFMQSRIRLRPNEYGDLSKRHSVTK